MVIIGLTGRSGSGKGFISEIFGEIGVPSIDTDLIYHEMTDAPSLCTRELADFYGECVLNSDGSLDRSTLADTVFSDPEKLKALNGITHKYIKEATVKLLRAFEESGTAYAVIDAPLLFESGFDSLCDYTVCAYTSDDVSVRRIVLRDGISEERARSRLSAQTAAEKTLSLTDYSVETDRTRDEIKSEILMILDDIERKERLKGE